MTGISYATSAEMAKELGAVPGLREEPRAHAARDPQPPPRRLRREDRLREGRDRRRCGSTTPPARDKAAGRARQARLGQGAGARRGARLPQRAGDRDRADRHDRPRHGLRHHRHRARLRAGEVQEARRRRLLQDHQPRGAGGAARARLQRERRSPRSRPTRSATARSARRPASTTPRCKAKGFTPEAIEKVEKALPTAFDIKFAFNKWTLGEDLLRDRSTCRPRSIASPTLRPAGAPGLHQARDRGRQRPRLRRDDGRGRAAPEARALCRCSTAPTRAARSASATSRSRATSA